MLGSEQLYRKLNHRVSKGIKEYQLIEPGDALLIGLSGGKDSLALLEVLADRMHWSNLPFSLFAVHIRMRGIHYATDVSYLAHFSKKWGVPFLVKTAAFDGDSNKNPCYRCSWNRRRMLFQTAQELGCNKIALGHHMDDILQTLLMNMVFQGSFSTMPPYTKMSRVPVDIIRPLCLVEERELIELANGRGYQKLVKECPYERDSKRSEIADVMRAIEKMSPKAKANLWASMSNVQKAYLPR